MDSLANISAAITGSDSNVKRYVNALTMHKEQELLRERTRVNTTGISSFQYSESSKCILFACDEQLVLGRTQQHGQIDFEILALSQTGPYFDPKLNETNERIAFIKNRDLWVAHVETGESIQLTNSDRDTLSFGVAEYVVQEEFDRYTGYWWAPHTSSDKSDRILYEIVDESGVDCVYIPRGDSFETHRYPRVGRPNAIVDLAIAYISQETNLHRKLSGLNSLKSNFPWYEYISRLGWLPDGSGQERMVLIKIPESMFTSVLDGNQPQSSSRIEVLLEECNKYWINTTNIFRFINMEDKRHTTFIYASERSGYRHLYLVTSKPNLSSHYENSNVVIRNDIMTSQITSGEGVVLDHEISVDETRKLVYFVGNLDTCLESHLYVSSYHSSFTRDIVKENKKLPGCVVGIDCESFETSVFGHSCKEDQIPARRLTRIGYSHQTSINKSCTRFITMFSSVNDPPSSGLFELVFGSDPVPTCKQILVLHDGAIPRVQENPFCMPVPEFFAFPTRTTLHGMIYKPQAFDPTKKYPTILFIYAGPHVQLVTNEWKYPRFTRSIFASLELGYVVVTIDSRGSYNRGIAFEGHIKHRMGCVELHDQIEGLIYLSSRARTLRDPDICTMWNSLKSGELVNHGFIDPNRIIIHGWSYGGYMSLMGMAQYPAVFRAAVPGAPVTDWKLYDTAYTERYMGLLDDNNGIAYRDGSVIGYASSFPDECDRLLIVHGLIDENVHFSNSEMLVKALIENAKPHVLQSL